ncbi:MAG: maturation protein [Sanya fiers-like virus 34]|nr:MAG: maturation protein [Sanya fiers-like virus 34]
MQSYWKPYYGLQSSGFSSENPGDASSEYSSVVSKLSNGIDFRVTTDVRGPKPKPLRPQPCEYRKLVYTAGSGGQSIDGRTAWFVTVDTETGPKQELRQGSKRTYISGIFHEASTVSPDQGVPGNRGWGAMDNPSALRDVAIGRVFEKIRGSTANVSVDLFEAKQTIAMLKNVTKLRQNYIDFFREFVFPPKLRKSHDNARRMRYVREKYMEARYGWTPLMSSIYDIADAAIQKGRPSQLQTFKERRSIVAPDIFTEKDFAGNDLLVPNSQARYSSKRIWSCLKSSRYQIALTVRPGSQDASWRDFASLNPLLLAWELAPLSFVGDWVIGIGDWLRALENYWNLDSSRFFEGYETYTFMSTVSMNDNRFSSYTGPTAPNQSVWTSSVYSAGGGFVLKTKKRVVLSGFPVPALPRVKNPLASRESTVVKRMFDSAALMTQAYEGFQRKQRLRL